MLPCLYILEEYKEAITEIESTDREFKLGCFSVGEDGT